MTSPNQARLQAVILDWAGTTVDYGCFAPVAAFLRAFQALNVPITLAQARAPMGLAKKEHIRAILNMDEVATTWQERYQRAPNETDLDELYVRAEAALRETIIENAQLIPGVAETIASLRVRGLKIGSTTGYTSELMTLLTPLAQAQGYEPDAVVCPDRVKAGRPFPWMAFVNMELLGVFPPAAVVKIGDTVPDVQEGLNAGMWTVGIVRTGNEVGLTLADVNNIGATEPQELYQRATAKLQAAGAHFIVDDLNAIVPVLDEINEKLAHGALP